MPQPLRLGHAGQEPAKLGREGTSAKLESGGSTSGLSIMDFQNGLSTLWTSVTEFVIRFPLLPRTKVALCMCEARRFVHLGAKSLA